MFQQLGRDFNLFPNRITKQLKTARCAAVRTTKFVNCHFSAILSAMPTSAATKTLRFVTVAAQLISALFQKQCGGGYRLWYN